MFSCKAGPGVRFPSLASPPEGGFRPLPAAGKWGGCTLSLSGKVWNNEKRTRFRWRPGCIVTRFGTGELMDNKGRLGILSGGGPAPGINSVISAATMEAVKSGLEVVGIFDGFEHLMKGRTEMVRPLGIEDVTRIHIQGGSILRVSRANPGKDAEDLRRTIESLRSLGINYLVSIGGDDTMTTASKIAAATEGAIRVAHVPKTIDNDLPIPGGIPTFGYETARHLGTEAVLNLIEESRTSNRWVFVVVMGRKAGHLALGIGKAAGAHVTVIPEEFDGDHIRLDDVCLVLEGAILKRMASGQSYGVAVVAEGIIEKLDIRDLENIPGADIAYDPHGHMRLEEVPIGAVLRRMVQGRCAARNRPIRVTDVTLGYTLRSAPPIPFDIDYTRTLGYGAIRYLLTDTLGDGVREGGMVCLEAGHLHVLPFSKVVDPATQRVKIRLVDISSEHYQVALEYMVRLTQQDLEDPEKLDKLAKTAGVAPDEFRRVFSRAVRVLKS